MFLSEVQEKDIIDLESGINLGKIIDVEIDDTGQIQKFTVEPRHFFRRFFKSSETIVSFSNIVKIGTDVILVKADIKYNES